MDDEQKRMLEELLFSGEKKLSFAKLLFFGGFHAPSVLPFPQPSPEEKTAADRLVEEIKAFATKNIDGKKIDQEHEIPKSVLSGLGALGLLGLCVAPEFHGKGHSQYTYGRAMAELATHCGSTALFVNAHQSIGLRALVLFGTEEQKKHWLPKLATGELVAAFSLTEPNAGSDASAVQTRAVYDPQKKVYRLTGQKQWTTNGSIADVLTVMAQTEVETPKGKQDQITAFLVTPDMPGFKMKDYALEKVGMRGTKTANLIFDNMEVPEANILGPKGKGLKVCLTVLDYGRTTFGATCHGQAHFLVKHAVEHAKSRIQFKRPLSTFPLVKRKLALMAAHAYAMEATSMLTAGLVDRGLEDFMLEAAILKVFASEALWTILYDTMQIYGGRSFFTDLPFERMMRDARLNMIGEGSNEVLRAFIALVGIRDVGMQFKAVYDAVKHPVSQFQLLKSFGKQCLGLFRVPDVPIKSKLLFEEAGRLARGIRKFSNAVGRVIMRYREDLVERQLVLDRLSDSVISLYTITAVLSRLDSDLAAQPLNDKLKDDLSIAKLYCRHAFNILDQSLSTLFLNDDSMIEEVSDQLTRTREK